MPARIDELNGWQVPVTTDEDLVRMGEVVVPKGSHGKVQWRCGDSEWFHVGWDVPGRIQDYRHNVHHSMVTVIKEKAEEKKPQLIIP